MTTRLYKDYGPDGMKPKTSKLIKNQAKFFLEGFIHFIRSYPKLVISTTFPALGVTILTATVSIAVVILAFVVFGIGWWNTFWLLFFFQTISAWVERVIVQHAHTLIMLDKFYKVLHEAEPINLDTLTQTIGSIPILAKIARKTGMSEFKGMKFEETCPSNLLEITAVEEMLGEEAKRMCALFNVHDEIPVEEPPTDEDVKEEPEQAVEDEPQSTDEQASDSVEVQLLEETTTPVEILIAEEEDDDEFSLNDFPSVRGPFVGKFDSSGGGLDE